MIDFEVLSITDVRHFGGHVLWLRFNDGVEGRVDLSDLLWGPAFERLRDPAFFAQVRILYDYTIGWPNDVDLAPEGLYDRLEVTGPEPKRDYQKLNDDAAATALAECAAMPEISRFFGIVIKMLWTEHEPPHFHAQYGEYVASITIRDGTVASHKFPDKGLKLIRKWRKLHKRELLENWERCRQQQPPHPIPPLD